MSKIESLTASLVEMEEQASLEQVKALLVDGESAQSILSALSDGMGIVGEKYSCQEYFLADLVFAAEIFKQALATLEPSLAAEAGGEREVLGKIVIGTVEGDLHDIGKNIFVALARNAGFEVNDLGIDVAPDTFVENVKRDGAQIVGMSAILTMAVHSMSKTIQALTEAGLRDKVKVIIGGLPVDDRWQEIVGSDAYTDNAYEGIKICQQFMEVV